MNFPVSPRRAFTLVEVILALGVLAVAIVAMLGLIGPTLGAVRTAQQINASTSAMAKMNALLDNAPFYDSTAPNDSVWTWLVDSNASGSNTPTVFIIYDAWPTGSLAGTNVLVPTMEIARCDFKSQGSTPATGVSILYGPESGAGTVDNFIVAVTHNRIVGPVIAMTISPSPMIQNFPITGPVGQEGVANGASAVGSGPWYKAPVTGSIFPTATGLPANPDAPNGSSINYPEAYVPLMIQAFVLPLENITLGEASATYEKALPSDLISANRIFTYTYVKLR